MEELNKAALAVKLIEVDILFIKLLIGLEKAGLSAERFYPDISPLVLQILGYKQISNNRRNIYII